MLLKALVAEPVSARVSPRERTRHLTCVLLGNGTGEAKKEDIILTDAPENVKVGAIVVEIWPYHLDVAKVRTIRNESFISGTVMTIELKLDEEGNYTD